MLYQGRMPASLWVDAFLTANFLINLIPTTANNEFISPFEKLNGKAPLYTSLRVFGCACFPYLRPYVENKFNPKSLMCVFLGYSEQHKGYICLYPPTGRVYLSRHVLFDENQFPYSDRFKDFIPGPITTLSKAWETTTSKVIETHLVHHLLLLKKNMCLLQDKLKPRLRTLHQPLTALVHHINLKPIQIMKTTQSQYLKLCLRKLTTQILCTPW